MDVIYWVGKLINVLVQGCNADLTSEESQILLAEFYLRSNKSTAEKVIEYAKQKLEAKPNQKL